MDETELRIAALEILMVDLLSQADAKVRDGLVASLSEGLARPGEPGHGGDEHTIRLAALELVKDSRLRHQVFTPFRPPPPSS